MDVQLGATCNCSSCCGVEAERPDLGRPDFGGAPVILGSIAVFFEVVVLVLFAITYTKREKDRDCRRASPALTTVTLMGCAATFGVSILWADNDISVSESLNIGAGCLAEAYRADCSSCVARASLTVWAVTVLWGSVLMRLLRTEALCMAEQKGGSFSRMSSARTLV